MPQRITGKLLSQKWKVDVKHALYSHDGTWYHRLKDFPGALFDSSGFVIFNTKDEFEGCPSLRLKKDCGCRFGISTIDGYVRVRNFEASDVKDDQEIERKETFVSRIIRDTNLSRELKLEYEDQCQICGVTVKLFDGSYSEAHHIIPLGSPHNGTDNKDNLIVVCPTCHVKMDYFSIPLSLMDLKVLGHTISEESVEYHNNQYANKIGERDSEPLRVSSIPPFEVVSKKRI